MTTVAFCGLGQMGAPMAARLLDAGHDLAVWNRTAERARPLADRGARQARSPADAAKGAEAVFTMLTDPAAVDEVVCGRDGVAAALAEGATLVEMSTIGPAAVRSLRRQVKTTVGLLDAPVLGSIPQATEGKLKVFVGGAREEFERRRPLLEAFGTVRYVGNQGAGAAMKLVTNLCLGVLMTGLGEAMALGDALGLERDDLLDVLAESPIGVTAKSKRSRIESGEYEPNFKLSLAAKDLRLVNEAAEQAHVPLTLAPAAWAWMETADAAGLGDLDYSAVIRKIRESSGQA